MNLKLFKSIAGFRNEKSKGGSVLSNICMCHKLPWMKVFEKCYQSKKKPFFFAASFSTFDTMTWVRSILYFGHKIMPSSGPSRVHKVDRSTSPLPRKPANPVQELKALFAEPPLRVSNGDKEDFRLEAIQCLQPTTSKEIEALPERGTWNSKVNTYGNYYRNLLQQNCNLFD